MNWPVTYLLQSVWNFPLKHIFVPGTRTANGYFHNFHKKSNQFAIHTTSLDFVFFLFFLSKKLQAGMTPRGLARVLQV